MKTRFNYAKFRASSMVLISAITLAGWLPAATTLSGDYIFTDNLSVVKGIDFGTAVAPVPVMEGEPPQTQAGVELSYLGAGSKTSYFDLIDELATFHLRDSRSYSGGRSKMKLDAANILTLYKNTGVTGMTFNSDTGQLNLTGTGSLTSYGPGVFANGLPIFTVGTTGGIAFGNRTFSIANTTPATSSTGALTVLGGIAIAKDSYFNGVKVGRGGNSVVSNTGVGNQALQANTTGSSNNSFGEASLFSNTTGSINSAFGAYSLYKNTIGNYNNSFGVYSLYNNISGNGNVAMGYDSLNGNSNGSFNSSTGYQSLYFNASGNYNSAFGGIALISNTTGSNNVALGYGAGQYQGDAGTVPLADPENSIYIGANSRGFSNADQNSIVIGASAVGEGANTTVIGTDATTKTHLYGTTETGGLVVDGQTLLKGQVILESAQGDIPMFTGN